MPTQITRLGSATDQITVTADPATSAGFSVNQTVGAVIYVDTVSAGATVAMTFYGKTDQRDSSTYLLVDSSNAAISQTIQAGRCFALPTLTTYGFRYIIPVVATGTATIRTTTKA